MGLSKDLENGPKKWEKRPQKWGKSRLKAKRKRVGVCDNNWEGGTERCDQSVLGFRLIAQFVQTSKVEFSKMWPTNVLIIRPLFQILFLPTDIRDDICH